VGTRARGTQEPMVNIIKKIFSTNSDSRKGARKGTRKKKKGEGDREKQKQRSRVKERDRQGKGSGRGAENGIQKT